MTAAHVHISTLMLKQSILWNPSINHINPTVYILIFLLNPANQSYQCRFSRKTLSIRIRQKNTIYLGDNHFINISHIRMLIFVNISIELVTFSVFFIVKAGE